MWGVVCCRFGNMLYPPLLTITAHPLSRNTACVSLSYPPQTSHETNKHTSYWQKLHTLFTNTKLHFIKTHTSLLLPLKLNTLYIKHTNTHTKNIIGQPSEQTSSLAGFNCDTVKLFQVILTSNFSVSVSEKCWHRNIHTFYSEAKRPIRGQNRPGLKSWE